MIMNYQVSGTERKRLAETIAEVIGVDALYMGPPTFSYKAGDFTVDRDGALVCDMNEDDPEVRKVLEAVDAAGFTGTEAEKQYLAIQMPEMTGDELSRLEALIESKESLLKKAIGAESLTVGEKDGKLDFPWFSADAEPEEVKAYMDLVTGLCDMAKRAKRVTGKDHPVENEKYAFRCFLLRLGFIGDEYKESRQVLLRNFTGSAAFKSQEDAEAFSEKQRAKKKEGRDEISK